MLGQYGHDIRGDDIRGFYCIRLIELVTESVALIVASN